MIMASDRVAAMTGCLAAGAIVVGAKASAVVLGIWAIVILLSNSRNSQVAHNERFGLMKPSPTAFVLLIFALLAGVSALWSNDPKAAIKAAALLALMLSLGHILVFAIRRLSPDAAVLMAGWFVIGLVCGSIILLEELTSNFFITRCLFEAFPGLRPASSFLARIKGASSAMSLSNAVGNWNVAGLNILLWPTLLLLSCLVATRKRIYGTVALLAFSALITFRSEHQTSQLAVVASTAVFALAYYSPKIMQRLAIIAFVVLIAGVVPVAQFAYQRLELQHASWAQFTLKERFRIWGHSSAQVPLNPVVGIGANNTISMHTGQLPPKNPSAALNRHHPHNMLLQVWLELGALGAGLLLLGGLAIIREVSRMHQRAAPFGYATIAMIGLQSVSTWNLWSVWIQAAFVMSWCLLVLGNRIVVPANASISFRDVWLPERLKWRRQHV